MEHPAELAVNAIPSLPGCTVGLLIIILEPGLGVAVALIEPVLSLTDCAAILPLLLAVELIVDASLVHKSCILAALFAVHFVAGESFTKRHELGSKALPENNSRPRIALFADSVGGILDAEGGDGVAVLLSAAIKTGLLLE